MPRRAAAPPKRAPVVVEHRVHQTSDGVGVDIRLRVALSGMDDVGPETVRRRALQELERILAELDEEAWSKAVVSGGQAEETDGPVEGPFHVPASQKRPPRPRLAWSRPDLPAKDLRTCHEVLEGLLLLGVHGRAVPVGELQRRRSIPQNRLYHVLDPESQGYRYLRPYIQDFRSHGRRLLDLTPEGRVLASRIRSGELETGPRSR